MIRVNHTEILGMVSAYLHDLRFDNPLKAGHLCQYSVEKSDSSVLFVTVTIRMY